MVVKVIELMGAVTTKKLFRDRNNPIEDLDSIDEKLKEYGYPAFVDRILSKPGELIIVLLTKYNAISDEAFKRDYSKFKRELLNKPKNNVNSQII
jgi:hypothetical protein